VVAWSDPGVKKLGREMETAIFNRYYLYRDINNSETLYFVVVSFEVISDWNI
jgi:hypothetical protein